MKVLFPFVGDTYGGSHVSALSLIDKIAGEQHISPVIGLHETGYFSSILDRRQIEWVSLPPIPYVQNRGLIRQFLQMVSCSKPLSRFLCEHKIDLVHTNDRRMHLSWLLAAKRAKVFHVWHQRNAVGSSRVSMYMLLASATVTISDYCRQSFFGPAKKHAIIIDNPVCFHAREEEPKKSDEKYPGVIDGRASTKNILFVGNLMERKRPLTFVRAAKHVVEDLSEQVIFTMVGEERQPMRDAVQHEIRKLGIESNLKLVGAQSDIEPWYAGADLVVAPAVNEGLGRTLIEASILDVPVVASRHGGHIEILSDGETGTFFEPDNPRDLADKIIYCLSNIDVAKKMALSAQRDCLERFSPTLHADRIASIYASLLGRSF